LKSSFQKPSSSKLHQASSDFQKKKKNTQMLRQVQSFLSTEKTSSAFQEVTHISRESSSEQKNVLIKYFFAKGRVQF
jgi:hypothetical protein